MLDRFRGKKIPKRIAPSIVFPSLATTLSTRILKDILEVFQSGDLHSTDKSWPLLTPSTVGGQIADIVMTAIDVRTTADAPDAVVFDAYIDAEVSRAEGLSAVQSQKLRKEMEKGDIAKSIRANIAKNRSAVREVINFLKQGQYILEPVTVTGKRGKKTIGLRKSTDPKKLAGIEAALAKTQESARRKAQQQRDAQAALPEGNPARSIGFAAGA